MITIYGTRGCGFCKLAVDDCKKLNMKYEYKDISIKKWYLELKSLVEYDHNIPKIFVDGVYLGNYDSLIDYIQEKRMIS
jgi:glutaredoxin